MLVTGASAGLGVELAREFARQGSRLVLVARRAERLAEVARALAEEHGVEAEWLARDLSEPLAAEVLCEELERRGLTIDVLVNNAGFGARGRVLELPLERQLDLLQVNLVTLFELTHRLLPAMVARGRGGVLNVSSTAAFQAGPHMCAYFATKAFVQSFTEGLHEELRGTGVTATALCPGATRTEFGAVSGMGQTPLFERLAVEPGPVARAGVAAFRAGRASVVTGAVNKLGVLGTRLVPRWLARRLVARLQG